MVTKEQADVIGNALVEQARDEKNERRNAAARQAFFMYRFPELDTFEPWERRGIVADANMFAMRSKSVLLVWILSFGAAIVWAYIAFTQFKGISPLLVWLPNIAIFAPMYFYRREVVRSYIFSRAKDRNDGVDAEASK